MNNYQNKNKTKKRSFPKRSKPEDYLVSSKSEEKIDKRATNARGASRKRSGKKKPEFDRDEERAVSRKYATRKPLPVKTNGKVTRRDRDAAMKEYVISEEAVLLPFLYTQYPHISKNAVKSLLKNKQIAINGAPISQFDAPLFPKDVVMVSKTRIPAKHTSDKFPLIYQDDEIIVINKPAGLLTVPTDRVKTKTAFRLTSDYVQYRDKHSRLYVIHRLDEKTSGVLMFGKSQEIVDAFQNNWNTIVKDRGYLAIVEGHMEKPEDTLSHYLCDSKTHLMFLTNKGDPRGQLAITSYKVVAESADYSLLDVHISTGKKNQIRVQLGAIGHNVIGDDKYGEPSNPIDRLGLHAYVLEYLHPLTGKQFKFRAPEPKEFKRLFPDFEIKSLRK